MSGRIAFPRSSPWRPMCHSRQPSSIDEKGRSDFGLLQRALGRRRTAHEPCENILYAFDLLCLEGRNLRRLPQRERQRLLDRFSNAANGTSKQEIEMCIIQAEAVASKIR